MPSRSKSPRRSAPAARAQSKAKPRPQSDPPKPRPQTHPPKPPGGSAPQPTLEQAIRDLNALYVPGSLRTALAVAAYVRDRFLGGETEGFNQQLEAPSLRELAGRDDLSFSVTYLSDAIGVYLQHPLLEPALAQALTYSHHRLLLRVPNPRDKNRLAALAVRRQLDVEDLRREVRAYRASHHLPPIGLPPGDPRVHALRRLYRDAGGLLQALQRASGRVPAEAHRIYRETLNRLEKAGQLLKK